MPRRSQNLVETLIYLPWWFSGGLGVLIYFVARGLLASYEGAKFFGEIAIRLRWVPPLLLFIFGGLAILSAFLGRRRKELIEGRSDIESIRGLTWSAFEHMVAEAYRRKGYSVDLPLRDGADGGVDVVLRKDGKSSLVQCKQWRNSVGAPTIRELFGLLVHEIGGSRHRDHIESFFGRG